MKRKQKWNMPIKYILSICTVLCICLIIFSFKYRDSMNPVKTYIGNIIKPMQDGVNSIGTSIYSVFDLFQTKETILNENVYLKQELERIQQENVSLIEDKNELSSLRELYQLDQGYQQYPKVAARVISQDDNK